MIEVAHPHLFDLMRLTASALDEEKAQYQALEGREWDTEGVAIEAYNKEGLKYVLLDNGTPIVAGGYEPIIPGVWQTWMIGTDQGWEKHWRSITKQSRATMNYLLGQGARRVQTCVLASREKACEWYCRGLLMRLESTFENFGINGEDMQVYVRLGPCVSK